MELPRVFGCTSGWAGGLDTVGWTDGCAVAFILGRLRSSTESFFARIVGKVCLFSVHVFLAFTGCAMILLMPACVASSSCVISWSSCGGLVRMVLEAAWLCFCFGAAVYRYHVKQKLHYEV